ncbi:MAG: mandelate racemase [Burkholderiaceae bacterium]|jgi:mandelate racemase|nr:mandelate racemase [Burkholderiaceae bacterium]
MSDSVLRISALRARPVLAPMRLPLQTSTGAVSVAPLLLLDLETSAGITGRSYLFAIGRAHLKPLLALVEAMGELLIGDELAPGDIERKLRQKHTLLGVHNVVLFAMSGIDMAAWDALAQSMGQPLVRLLGGVPRPVRAYNSNGLGIMAPKPLARQAEQLVEEGFSAIKLRLGRPDPRDDLIALRAVKKAIGPDVTLMCDFNQALTVNEAILRGRQLDDEGGLYWIEEPTRADDFAGNRRIADALTTPVQIGENFMGPEQMAQALAAQASDYVMPDAQRIGGVTGWMRGAALAQGAGLEMSSHLFPEVSCHLLAVTPTAHWLEFVDWAAPVLAQPLTVSGGLAMVPDRPGTGIEWDEVAVTRYAA